MDLPGSAFMVSEGTGLRAPRGTPASASDSLWDKHLSCLSAECLEGRPRVGWTRGVSPASTIWASGRSQPWAGRRHTWLRVTVRVTVRPG